MRTSSLGSLAFALAMVVATILSGGCARYEYDVAAIARKRLMAPAGPDATMPATRAVGAVAAEIDGGSGPAMHVGEAWIPLPLDPLEYRLITYENRLVMRVRNPSGDPVTLLGAESYVVDPRGQSHPLPAQTIAPGSFIKVVLPPLPAEAIPSGPRIGIGFGGFFGSAYGGRRGGLGFYQGGFLNAWDNEPRYYAVYEGGNNFYWEWDGEGTARLVLVFRRGGRETGGESFRHSFEIRRRRA